MNVKVYIVIKTLTGEVKCYGNMKRLANDYEIPYNTLKGPMTRVGYFSKEGIVVYKRDILR